MEYRSFDTGTTVNRFEGYEDRLRLTEVAAVPTEIVLPGGNKWKERVYEVTINLGVYASPFSRRIVSCSCSEVVTNVEYVACPLLY